ncbi:Abortive infection protein [Carbonactinospora thermoautotrophica]|uniref:Abortive infection protein n=2 Tax=Carbonactinospora thermoautotrophica TaxID=1469144 RepID=A0A132MTA3_9ACTN|nr:Abortive infection protein [Carbonactinospora thermoautotrophica]
MRRVTVRTCQEEGTVTTPPPDNLGSPAPPPNPWTPPDSSADPWAAPPAPPTPPRDQRRAGWFASPPPGASYAQLARTSRHRWWRPIVGTLVVVVAWLLGAGLLMVVLARTASPEAGFDPDTLWPKNPTWALALSLATIAVALPAIWLAAIWVQRRRPGTLSSVAGRLRWRWLAHCLGPALVALLIAFTVYLALVPGEMRGVLTWNTTWTAFLTTAAVIVLLVPFQAAAEEYLTRGWLVQAAGAYLRTPWVGILLSAVVFAALHLPPNGWTWLAHGSLGVLLAWLTVRTGGLEAAIAYHTVNNLVVLLLEATAGPIDLSTVRAADWRSVVAELVGYAVFAWLVVRSARRHRVASVVAAEERSPRGHPAAA